MTRKDYVAIAQAISDGALVNCATAETLAMNSATRRKIAQQIADMLARDNPRFDGARFLKACGVQS